MDQRIKKVVRQIMEGSEIQVIEKVRFLKLQPFNTYPEYKQYRDKKENKVRKVIKFKDNESNKIFTRVKKILSNHYLVLEEDEVTNNAMYNDHLLMEVAKKLSELDISDIAEKTVRTKSGKTKKAKKPEFEDIELFDGKVIQIKAGYKGDSLPDIYFEGQVQDSIGSFVISNIKKSKIDKLF